MLRNPPPPKHGGLGVPKRRASKTTPLPVTGERPDMRPKTVIYVRYLPRADGSYFRERIPDFVMRSKAGFAVEGSDDEAKMKKEIGL